MERFECMTEGGRSPVNLGSWLISQTVNQEIGFADDSSQEGAGFELAVADQKKRGRFLGGTAPFGWQVSEEAH